MQNLVAVGHVVKTERLDAKLRAEFGPLIVSLLEASETLEDILLNADGRVWVKHSGHDYTEVGVLPETRASGALNSIATMRGTVVNHDRPILETELPIWGARFEGLVPPIVTKPVFAIRKRAGRVFSLDDYARQGILTHKDDPRNRIRQQEHFVERVSGKSHLEVLQSAICEQQNILVVGATGSGKTTFINALLLGMAELTPQDRLVIIEDTPELQIKLENYVALQATGNVSMLDCLRATMRLRPTRIVVGEVRGKEALTMIKAWNTGHPGGAASIHANDAYAGLVRLEALVAEATDAPQQRLIAEAIDLVVSVGVDGNEGRKVREIAVVKDFADGHYVLEFV